VSGQDIQSYLEALPLFKELAGQAALQDLAAICEMHRARAGEVVVTEGSEGDTMYVIKEGRVRVEKRTPYKDTYTVSFLSAGDFFGEAALLNRDRRSATCLAETDGELLVIGRPRFLEFGDRHPAAGLLITRKIAGHLAHRLLSANEDIVTLFSALVEEVEGAVLGE
jgi:CRP/FNR family transcriptional regulator, cyclic AMP receptor protein